MTLAALTLGQVATSGESRSTIATVTSASAATAVEQPEVPQSLRWRFAEPAAGQPASRSDSPATRFESPNNDPNRGGSSSSTSGQLSPRYYEFSQAGSTPQGNSVWRVAYGLEYSGGLQGLTDDVEYQILDATGAGRIRSAGVFAGSLDGRAGGFAFESTGRQNVDGTFVHYFTILPNTGYDQMTGLSGQFQVVASRSHCQSQDTPETCETRVSYTMTYRIPAAR